MYNICNMQILLHKNSKKFSFCNNDEKFANTELFP